MSSTSSPRASSSSRQGASSAAPSTPAAPAIASMSIVGDMKSADTIIGPYSLGGVIGAGIFAQVKVGTDEFRQTVAIKIFDKASIMAKHNTSAGGSGGSNASNNTNSSTHSTASTASTPSTPNIYQSHQLAQIEKELNALRRCSHPHIVQFYDVLETDRSVFLIMEHLNAGELYDYILNKGRLDEKESKKLFRQVVEAVQHLHSLGIVHRD